MWTLPNVDIVPSRVGLGTAVFGSDIGKRDSFAVMDAYFEAGGNLFDTAHIYASWIENGTGASERTLGEWIRVNGVRDRIVLATKGAHPPMDNMAHGRCGQADIESDLSESLERLGLDRVDLYWLHRDDPDRPVGAIVETLAGIVRDGRIRCYGASNWTTPRLAEANAYAVEHGLAPFCASQVGWALADHPAETIGVSGMLYMDAAMRQWHLEHRLPVAAYTSQAGGFFGAENVAWAKAGFAGDAPRGKSYDTPQNRARLSRAIALAEAKGYTANQIALSYLLRHPFPVCVLVGTGKPGHLFEAMQAPSVSLSRTEWESLAVSVNQE